jgi:excisionase family DNA binding protein
VRAINRAPSAKIRAFSLPHLRSSVDRIGSVLQAEKGPTNVSQLDERRHFMTVAEVAQLMRVSTMTVYRLIKAGELSAIRVGRSYRLRPDDVDQYLGDRYTEAG